MDIERRRHPVRQQPNEIPEAHADASVDEEAYHLDYFAHPQAKDLDTFFN